MELTDSLLKQQIFAFGKITSGIEIIKTNDETEEQTKAKAQAKYKSFIENFGLMVYNNGLINALAVAKVKNKDVYKHISAWLIGENDFGLKNENGADLINQLLSDSVGSQKLMLLTNEVLSLSDTLKVFAKSEFKDDGNKSS